MAIYFIIAADLLLLAAAILLLVFGVYTSIIGPRQGAPFVPSSRRKIAVMLELARVKSGEKVLDLGSGDGAVLMAVARCGAYATGVEINPLLVWYSRGRIRMRGLAHRAVVRRGNFYDFPLGGADVVLLYLWPSTVARLREKMERELKPGARVVSQAFSIPGWMPVHEENGIFLYHPGVKNQS